MSIGLGLGIGRGSQIRGLIDTGPEPKPPPVPGFRTVPVDEPGVRRIVEVNTDTGTSIGPIYNTLANAEANERSLNETEITAFVASGSAADTAEVQFSATDWGTTPIEIWQAESDYTAGNYDDTKYRLSTPSNAITATGVNILIDGLQVNAGSYAVRCFSSATFIARRCVLRSSGSNAWVVFCNDSSVTASSCLVHAIGNTRGIGASGAGAPVVNIYNCTCIGVGLQEGVLRFAGTVTCTNVLVNNFSVDFFGSIGGSHNASSDATAPGPNSHINETFEFEDEANSDYHLDVTDGGAKGRGTPSGEAYAMTYDVEGHEWNNPPSIGFSEADPAQGP